MNYVDGFVFPISRKQLDLYKSIANEVSNIWIEYGALAYYEFVADELNLEGTRPFTDAFKLNANEDIVFGWVVFPSKDIRDEAHQKVAADSRMSDLISPLVDPNDMIFEGNRMLFGGFKPLIQNDINKHKTD